MTVISRQHAAMHNFTPQHIFVESRIDETARVSFIIEAKSGGFVDSLYIVIVRERRKLYLDNHGID